MLRIPPRLLLLSLLVTSTGCAARTQPGDLPAREFVGHLSAGNNGFWFRECGRAAGERWWVTFTGASIPEFADIRAELEAGRSQYVRLNAAMTDERHVGPGGPALLVRRILEARPEAASDCQP